MRGASPNSIARLRTGDRVIVRPFREILSTLDAQGALDGLPFLPEMLKFCGHVFTVRRRVDKLIQEGTGSSMRRIRNVVLLEETVCDGRSHGDCQRACFPLWKTAWLRLAGNERNVDVHAAEPDGERGVRPSDPTLPAGRGCQVTELLEATRPLPLWHPARHFLELKARTYSLREYATYILKGIHKKTLERLTKRFSGKRTIPSLYAPDSPLDLKPGDLVEVKSAAEVRATLDADGRCRGLYFMPGMWAYCGRRLHVLHPVARMMSEKTGEMRALKGTVILEGVTCDGKAHGGCQRGCLVFWKDVWLRRAGSD